jgi:glycerol-3-phosphate dehydrogenase
MATWRLRRAAAAIAASSAVVAAGAAWPSASASDPSPAALEAARRRVAQPGAAPPPRAAQRAALAGSTPADPLDVLVVGGGATGCGVALDAATRGLRVGLVEREDFSSGTSSRSTKLIHGGAWLPPIQIRLQVDSSSLLLWHLTLYLYSHMLICFN